MSETQSQVLYITDASIQNAALIAHVLGGADIPSALWGVNAAAHYGGGLCALDIELVINGSDQERAYNLLTSRGFHPSIPADAAEGAPTDYADWRRRATSYVYRDRRRVRISTPIYDSPLTGDPIDDAMRPFIILYSAESVGLPKVPTLTNLEASVPSNGSPYIQLDTSSPSLGNTEDIDFKPCLIPTFARLLESDIHALLRHAEIHSPVWGQHMAQISELARSRSAPQEDNGLVDVVGPRYRQFAAWMQSSLKGNADHEDLKRVQEAFLEDANDKNSVKPDLG